MSSARCASLMASLERSQDLETAESFADTITLKRPKAERHTIPTSPDNNIRALSIGRRPGWPCRILLMGKAPKSSFDLAMERLRANDRKAGVEENKLSPAQKNKIAEARRVATSRFAEREILFRDAMQKTDDPAEREKAEREYQLDRQRITDDRERAIEAIRRQAG